MQNLIKNLKDEIIKLSQNTKFIHHKWFIKYHLEIVEKISIELCDIYKDADKNIVLILVWMHDYWKIINYSNEHEETLLKWEDFLINLWFGKELSKKIISYIEIYDKKENLASEKTPIEIKIVSSADWASHLVWPFFYLWWYENNSKDFEELMKNNTKKALIDWEKKVVLPEVKENFLERHNFLLEQSWKINDKFLN